MLFFHFTNNGILCYTLWFVIFAVFSKANKAGTFLMETIDYLLILSFQIFWFLMLIRFYYFKRVLLVKTEKFIKIIDKTVLAGIAVLCGRKLNH